MPKCSGAWVPEWSRAQVLFEFVSAWVLKCHTSVMCPSTLMPWVPKCLSAPSAQCARSAGVRTCLSSALSGRVPFDCVKCSRFLVPSVRWVPNCFSQSVSQSASPPVGLQCWFSKLISTLRGHTWTPLIPLIPLMLHINYISHPYFPMMVVGTYEMKSSRTARTINNKDRW